MVDYSKLIITLVITLAGLCLLTIKVYLDYGFVLAVVIGLLVFTLCFFAFWVVGVVSILDVRVATLISINDIAYYAKLAQKKSNQQEESGEKLEND